MGWFSRKKKVEAVEEPTKLEIVGHDLHINPKSKYSRNKKRIERIKDKLQNKQMSADARKLLEKELRALEAVTDLMEAR